jgi:hypothetical protein
MYIAELIDIRIAMILQIPFIFEDYVILVTKVIDVRLLITPFVASNLYCILTCHDMYTKDPIVGSVFLSRALVCLFFAFFFIYLFFWLSSVPNVVSVSGLFYRNW